MIDLKQSLKQQERGSIISQCREGDGTETQSKRSNNNLCKMHIGVYLRERIILNNRVGVDQVLSDHPLVFCVSVLTDEVRVSS